MSSGVWKRLDYVPLGMETTRFAQVWATTPP